MSEWSFFSPVAITCAGHRGPRRRMCVSYLFLFLFFKKKINLLGVCDRVSVFPAFRWLGLDPGAGGDGARHARPPPVREGRPTHCVVRCRCGGIVSGTTERAWSAPLLLLPASGSWLVQQQQKFEDRKECGAGHNTTAPCFGARQLPIGSQASLWSTLLTHGVFIGSWHAPGTFELELQLHLHQYIPYTSAAAAAASFPAFRSWVKKKDSGTRAAGFPWEIAGNQRNFQHLFSGNSLPQLLLAGLKQSCGAGGRVCTTA